MGQELQHPRSRLVRRTMMLYVSSKGCSLGRLGGHSINAQVPPVFWGKVATGASGTGAANSDGFRL